MYLKPYMKSCCLKYRKTKKIKILVPRKEKEQFLDVFRGPGLAPAFQGLIKRGIQEQKW
eukprot:UN13601